MSGLFIICTLFLFPCYIVFTIFSIFNLRRDYGNSWHVIVTFFKHICKGLVMLIGLFRLVLLAKEIQCTP